jgi:NAD(P)-dependent dehydrogenase (short-subunit alcohol dehydrogenase family)
VKRPPAYYAHLLPGELAPVEALPAEIRPLLQTNVDETHLNTVFAGYLLDPHSTEFPPGLVDEYGQQIDNRDFNSWVMRLEDVPPLEMVEVQLVNSVAPAVLAGRLKPMLERSPHSARFIVNVSAAEGRFAQYKNGYHPHTNMAKAALNMLTRTIAEDYARSRIYVTSVDPGWISDQVPRADDAQREVGKKYIPIDMIDAAARVCDPVFSAVSGERPTSGRLIKDYSVSDW